MTQFIWALIGFFLTAIFILIVVVLPGIVTLPFFLAGVNFLSLAFSVFILLIVLAAIFARALQSTPAGFPFWLVSLLYLLLTGAVLYFGITTLLATSPLLLITALVFGSLFVIHFIVTFIVYALSATLQTTMSRTPTEGELSGRGFAIGMNAAVNAFVAGCVYMWLLSWLFGPGGATLLTLLIVASLLITAVRCVFWPTSGFTKGMAGWLTPLMPTAWYTEAWGWLVFTLNLLCHVLFSWIPGVPAAVTVASVNLIEDTGTIVTGRGAITDLSPVRSAFTSGRFTQMVVLPPPAGRLAHEIGHHINLGAFGGHWSVIGWLDTLYKRTVLGVDASGSSLGVRSYSERITESNVPFQRARRPRVDMWTPDPASSTYTP